MRQARKDAWVNEQAVLFKRITGDGQMQITCNPKARMNFFNYPEDGWVTIEPNYRNLWEVV